MKIRVTTDLVEVRDACRKGLLVESDGKRIKYEGTRRVLYSQDGTLPTHIGRIFQIGIPKPERAGWLVLEDSETVPRGAMCYDGECYEAIHAPCPQRPDRWYMVEAFTYVVKCTATDELCTCSSDKTLACGTTVITEGDILGCVLCSTAAPATDKIKTILDTITSGYMFVKVALGGVHYEYISDIPVSIGDYVAVATQRGPRVGLVRQVVSGTNTLKHRFVLCIVDGDAKKLEKLQEWRRDVY